MFAFTGAVIVALGALAVAVHTAWGFRRTLASLKSTVAQREGV